MVNRLDPPQPLSRVLLIVLALHGAVLLFQPQAQAPLMGAGNAIEVTFQTVGTLAAAPAKRLPPAAKRPTTSSPVAATRAPVASPSAPGQEGSDEGAGEAVGTYGGSGTGRAHYDLREMYLGELRARIDQHKNYPLQARRLGQSGEVVVAFTIGLDGQIVNPRVMRPSPFKKLNESALAAINAIRNFRPLPNELSTSPLEVVVPIRYSLNSMN